MDSLSIFDGGSSIALSFVAMYCGDSIPPSHVSSSNEVMIYFHTNEYGTEAGFKMEYNPSGKAHQFKTTLNFMRIIIENYWSCIHLARSFSEYASITIFLIMMYSQISFVCTY